MENRRVLIVGDLAFFTRQMDQNYAEKVRALIQSFPVPLNLLCYGPGFPNYRGKCSALALVRQHQMKAGDVLFHLICPGDQEVVVSQLAHVPRGIVKILDIEDTLGVHRLSQHIVTNRFNAVTFRYACSFTDQLKRRCRGVRFYHWTHYIDTGLHKPPSDPVEKDVDILLFGCTVKRHYPFRDRLHRLLQNNRLGLRVAQVPHPGYGRAADRSKSPVGENLVNMFHRSWLTVCTPSKYNYYLKKYAEVALSGSMPLGNLPPRGAQLQTDDIVHIHPSMSDAQILETIRVALSDKQTLAERTARLDTKMRPLHSYEAATAAFHLIITACVRSD